MPQRTFSALDVINFNLDVNNTPGNTSDIVGSGTAFNDILASATDSIVAGDGHIISVGGFNAIGNFDFQIIPAIPLNALITQVKARYAGSISLIASAERDAFGAIVPTMFVQLNPTGFSGNDLFVADTTPVFSPYLFTDGQDYTLDSSEDIVDFDPALTYDELVAQYGTLEFLGVISLDLDSQGGVDSAASFQAIIQITSLELIVTYDEGPISNDFTLDTTEAAKGDKVSISSIQGGLEDVEEIQVTIGGKTFKIPKIDWWFASPNQIIYYNPANEDGEATILLIGPKLGTQFSGSVSLGTMTILFEDTSGIYRIVKGKPTDTLYDPDRSGAVIIVKIPDPYAATGFVDG